MPWLASSPPPNWGWSCSRISAGQRCRRPCCGTSTIGSSVSRIPTGARCSTACNRSDQATARAALDEPPTTPAPALPLSSLLPEARVIVCMAILVIEVTGDTLTLMVGPRRAQMALRHWNRDTFLISWPESDASPGASGFATFALDPKGQLASLTLDPFSDVDKGLLRAHWVTPHAVPVIALNRYTGGGSCGKV